MSHRVNLQNEPSRFKRSYGKLLKNLGRASLGGGKEKMLKSQTFSLTSNHSIAFRNVGDI